MAAQFIAVAVTWWTSPSLHLGLFSYVGDDVLTFAYLAFLALVFRDDAARLFGRSVHEACLGVLGLYTAGRVSGLLEAWHTSSLDNRAGYWSFITTQLAAGVAMFHYHRSRVLGTIDPHSEVAEPDPNPGGDSW